MSLDRVELLMPEVGRLLTDRGRFIVAITHPCFSFGRRTDPESRRRYLDCYSYDHTLDRSLGIRVNAYHRPLQYYIDQLLQNGFRLTGLREVAVEMPQGHTLAEQLVDYQLTSSALLLSAQRFVDVTIEA